MKGLTDQQLGALGVDEPCGRVRCQAKAVPGEHPSQTELHLLVGKTHAEACKKIKQIKLLWCLSIKITKPIFFTIFRSSAKGQIGVRNQTVLVLGHETLGIVELRLGVKVGVVVHRQNGHLHEDVLIEVNLSQGGALRRRDASLQTDDVWVLSKGFLDDRLKVGGVIQQLIVVLLFVRVKLIRKGGQLAVEALLNFRLVGQFKEGSGQRESGGFKALKIKN